jgi:hypothetical protein
MAARKSIHLSLSSGDEASSLLAGAVRRAFGVRRFIVIEPAGRRA